MKPDKSEDKKPPAPRKVFDVMRPGKAPASPTSRPIISGHKNKVQDSVSGVGGVGEGRSLNKHKKIELAHNADAPAKEAPEKEKEKVAPAPLLTAEPPASKATPEPEPAKSAEPALESVVASVAPEVSEKKEAKPAPPPAETPAPADDSMKVQLPSEGPMPPAPELEAAKDNTPAPIPSHEEIIVGHHGPIDAPGQALLLLGLIIVLALVAVNILLDAEVLKIDGIPHTNFFK